LGLTALIELSHNPAQGQSPLSLEPFRVVVFPDGAPGTLFYRTPSGYLLRFSDLADFEISLKDGPMVGCTPAPGAASEAIEHIYLNQVVPMALSSLGALVFHASAVEIAGEVVAFIGESGRGKSTLAAAFARDGHRFLTDDALVVEAREQAFLVRPTHPFIRLCHDSAGAVMGLESTGYAGPRPVPKTRIYAGRLISFCQEPQVLRAAYFLGDGAAENIRFRRLGAAETLIGWLKHAFVLDIEDRDLVRDCFSRSGALANGMTCFELDFPRRYDHIDRVLEAVAQHRAAHRGAA